MSAHPFSRRQFIAKASAAALISRFGRMNALAQAAQPAQAGYQALVCVFMQGGNDGHNTLVPQSQAQFNAYKTARGSLALPDDNGPILPIENSDGTPYALNPGLAAIQPLWAQGKLAVLANVGNLVQPTNRSQYLANSVPVPSLLFSHPDQVAQMQSGVPSSAVGTGWGGRVADQLQSLNGVSPFPATCSIAGPALYCIGNVVQNCALLPGFNLGATGMQLWPQSAGVARQQGLQQVIQFNSGLSLIQAANESRQNALALNALLSSASGAVSTPFPGTTLGAQLQQVANIINIRNSTGMIRQVFFCNLSPFDTHGGQSWQQFSLLQQTAQAMLAFYQATQAMGVSSQVTTFTLSEFGRTLQPSGTGSDHGWGNHHFILGDAVKGGTLYGTFPNLALGGPDDSGVRGAMIPSTSIDEFGATLATWLGVPAAQLPAVFPNIANFANPNLGFMGA